MSYTEKSAQGASAGPGDGVPLSSSLAELLPADGEPAGHTRRYFDPLRWDAELVHRFVLRDGDPVASAGLVEGRARAVIFFSDFHIADGSAGGDDFLERHLHREDRFGGLYCGFFPPGESRARLFLSVLTFALKRLAACGHEKPDIVLNGDVINFLELKGRGGTYVAPSHAPFFRGLAVMQERGSVFWLRGNHDYVVPSGPWHSGDCYVNRTLQTLAEHGDFWDKENWPPGPTNKGARLIVEGGAVFESNALVNDTGEIHYLLSGLDNLRPWSDESVHGFLDRRSKLSDVAAVSALLARLRYVGAADDRAAYEGALERRKGTYRDWLMVQGHTHVPAAVPGVYYNLGSWTSSLVASGGEEAQIEIFPFLLVSEVQGRRLEEYFIVRNDESGANPRAFLQTPESVNAVRQVFGYESLTR
jgi:UDP-2,3-diacylglucosamine pyrophosphatase LpxH